MPYVFWTIAIVRGAIVGFVVWRLALVRFRSYKRDAILFRRLEPIWNSLQKGKAPAVGLGAAPASRPELRQMLYDMLRNQGHESLFPNELVTETAQAEAIFAHWMLHPNELGELAEATDNWQIVNRVVDLRRLGVRRHLCTARFHVFHYRMPRGPWDGDGWGVAVVGPFADGTDRFGEHLAAFSRVGDTPETTDQNELVDWFMGKLGCPCATMVRSRKSPTRAWGYVCITRCHHSKSYFSSPGSRSAPALTCADELARSSSIGS